MGNRIANMYRRALPGVAGVALILAPGTSAWALQHEHPGPARAEPSGSAQELKAGKADDVSFEREVRVGEVTLKPGKYRVQHRVEGEEHFVRFEALATTTPSAQKLGTGMPVSAGTAGEIRCRVEPLPAKAKDTTLHLLNEGTGQRLTRLVVRGESVSHLF